MQYRNNTYAVNTFYFEKNLQGDVVAIYNESGVKVLSYTYDAWGNHTMTWHSYAGHNIYASYNPFRYRGYYYDTETELYYLQSRYYNPQWGWFLNADAIYYLGDNYSLLGYNLYAYCCNNPIMFSDPTGHFVGTLIAGFALGVLGGAAVDYVLQLVNNDFDFGNIDYGSVANSAIVGGGLGLSSAIGVITLGPALASGSIIGTKVLHGLCAAATISFSAGAIGYMTENLMNKTYWNPAAAVMHGVFVTMEGLHCYVAGGIAGSWGQIGTKGPLLSTEKVLKTIDELLFSSPHKLIINMLREKLEEIFEYEFS